MTPKTNKPQAGSGKCACADKQQKHTEKAKAMPKAIQPSK
jgi:hypothetical protein